jgi:hypothetical protein
MSIRGSSGGPPPEVLQKARQIFRDREEKRRSYKERFGYGRTPVCARMGDKWMVAVGGGIYRQIQEGEYGFLNVIHDYALTFLSVPFLVAEEAKPSPSRHPAVRWMNTYVDLRQRLDAEGNADYRAGQIGAGAEWFRFAYDVFMISDNSKLEARLKRRLLDPKTFQAARHELRVAALCVVAGFDVNFENEEDNSTGHTEFIAVDRLSPAKISVEAKSRHRRGVQGFEGGQDIEPGDRVDVRGIVLEAYRKKADFPLYVFVDANLPPVVNGAVWQRWMGEIEQTMSDLAAEGYANPCPANIVFFMNDPSHYLADDGIGDESDRVWIRGFTAKSPRMPHPSSDIQARIFRAHQQRLAPPRELPDFQ